MGNKTNFSVRNYTQNGQPKRDIYITGEISADADLLNFFGIDATSAAGFKSELNNGTGDIDLYINSPGGDVFIAAEIYHEIANYTGGRITVKIYSLCASAATVLAMAASKVYMSPASMMMIHNPCTLAVGDSDDMRRTAGRLDTVKETIINAYEKKTGRTREELSAFMQSETTMDVNKAIELGFCDGVLPSEQDQFKNVTDSAALAFYNSVKENKYMALFEKKPKDDVTPPVADNSIDMSKYVDKAEYDALKAKLEAIENKQTATPVSSGDVVSRKDFETVSAQLLKTSEEYAALKNTVAELQAFKSHQEAVVKAEALIGLVGVSEEERIELAKNSSEEAFKVFAAQAEAMRKLENPVGVTVSDADCANSAASDEARIAQINNLMSEKGLSFEEAEAVILEQIIGGAV